MNRDWSSIDPDDIDNDSGYDEQEYHDNASDIGELPDDHPELENL